MRSDLAEEAQSIGLVAWFLVTALHPQGGFSTATRLVAGSHPARTTT